MAKQYDWWYSLSDEDRVFYVKVPPRVMWCLKCKLLVVAFYAGHCEDLCQHCGSVCENVSACIGPNRWDIHTPPDHLPSHIKACPGSLRRVLRGDYATCVCGQQFQLINGLIPSHSAKQPKPESLTPVSSRGCKILQRRK